MGYSTPYVELYACDIHGRHLQCCNPTDLSIWQKMGLFKAIVFATKLGEIKRMDLKRIVNIRANGINSMDLEDGDDLISVRLADRGSDVLMVSFSKASNTSSNTLQTRYKHLINTL